MSDWLREDITLSYVLDADHNPVPEPDIRKAGMFFQDIDKRRVAETEIGPYRISTVFLCFDHRYLRTGRPILFETMVFDAAGDDCYMRRYTTWDAAAQGHARVVRVLTRQLQRTQRSDPSD